MKRELLSIVAMLSVLAALAAPGETLQMQIDSASAAGGGVVRIGSGVHRSPAILLKAGVTLHLEKGAVLQAETNSAAFAATAGHAFILADGVDGVAIEGDGVIDGGGAQFPPGSLEVYQQPRLVWFRDCRNVRIEGVTLRNGRRWSCYFDRCDGVSARKVKIRSVHQKCCDGFDIECKNAVIEDCDIQTQDDAIVFKARSSDYTVENVKVRKCRLATNCALIKVGTETLGTIRNITVEDCVCRRLDYSFSGAKRRWAEFDACGVKPGPFAVLGIALGVLDGGRLENVTIRRISLNDSSLVPIFIRLAKRTGRVMPGPSLLENVLIEDVTGSSLSSIGCSITGLKDMRPSHITLRNVNLLMCNGNRRPADPLPEPKQEKMYVGMWESVLPAYGFYLEHADDVTFKNVRITENGAGLRPPFRAVDCERLKMEGCAPTAPLFLDRGWLDKGEDMASWSAIYNSVFDLDAAADDAWRSVGSVQEFDSRRRELRAKMVGRLGGFPSERTPLNAKVTGTAVRNGYRVENIMFESRPGAYVTGNLYVPESPRFKPPYPAALEVCGHSFQGKNNPNYQRVALLAARCGVAALVIDPLGQGERCQCDEDLDGRTTSSHLRLGVNAMLLGHGLAAFEMWDAMRALDYLDSRDDVRHDGYGVFGNSGGGTQSVMLSALDDRIRATATTCFLSNLREQTAWRLLADSEQIIFAQLSDGLNHAGYPLLGGNPVLMLARRDEMIPFTGTRETFRVLTAVAENLGRKGWYSMYDIPGVHGYCERNMRMTAAFLAKRLRGDEADFSGMDGDWGPEPGKSRVTKTGRVMDEPGFKSAYAYLQEELDVALSARGKASGSEEGLSALVRRIADIDEGRVGSRDVVSTESLKAGGTVTRATFAVEGGYRIPAVEIVPASVKGVPVLLVGDGLRKERMADAERLFGDGRPVMMADIVATGEIGNTRHHYSNPHDDEEVAKMLYITGSSLVGRRAGEIIAIAKDMKARFGAAPEVVARGRTAVAAAHAFAAAPDAISNVRTIDPPASWAESVRTRTFYDYAAAVHGGLLHYDWTDLLCAGGRNKAK